MTQTYRAANPTGPQQHNHRTARDPALSLASFAGR
jgi:hypothetical protein